MQRRSLMAVLVILCTLSADVSAADRVDRSLDLRNATDVNGRFFVIFCARSSSADGKGVGHAFVVWAEENDEKKLSAETAFGFYPAKDKEKGILGPVPGDVKNEATERDPAKLQFVTHRLTVQVNESVWKSSQKRISVWETEQYELFRNNCVHFAYDVAGDIGLLVAKPRVEYPSSFLERLIERAKPGT